MKHLWPAQGVIAAEVLRMSEKEQTEEERQERWGLGLMRLDLCQVYLPESS